MDRPIRWGIVGSGAMAEAFVRDLRHVPRAIAVGVASRSHDRAAEFAKRFGVGKAFTNVEELVSSPEIDVVYVASLNHQHANHALSAIDSGKAVLCEKPFARNADEARVVVDRARRRRVFCMEAMWSRFLPGMVRLRSLVRDGSIGRVRMLSAQIGYPFESDPTGRLWDPEKAGGAMLDLGVYPLSLAIDLMGPIEQASGTCSICETGVDDQAGMVLRHRDGGTSVISASISCSMSNEAIVSGDGGLVRIHEPFFRPVRLTVRSTGPTPLASKRRQRPLLSRWRESIIGSSLMARAGWIRRLTDRSERVVVSPHAGSGYQYQVTEVIRCLDEGRIESQIMPLEDSIATLEAIDLVRCRGKSVAALPG